MLDSDVAMLYNYPTKRINETVSRNKIRFPENFCFKLSEHEFEVLKLQYAILVESTQIENEKEATIMRSQFATASKRKQ